MSDMYLAVNWYSFYVPSSPQSSLPLCNRGTDMITFVFSILSWNRAVIKRRALESKDLGLSPDPPTCRWRDLGKSPYGCIPKVPYLTKEKSQTRPIS